MRDEEGLDLTLLLDPFFDAIGAGDIERIRGFLAEDAECRSPWAVNPIHRGSDKVAMEIMERRKMFSSVVAQEVLLGVRCATYMMLADGNRMALTLVLRDDNLIQLILVCADAEIPYQRVILART